MPGGIKWNSKKQQQQNMKYHKNYVGLDEIEWRNGTLYKSSDGEGCNCTIRGVYGHSPMPYSQPLLHGGWRMGNGETYKRIGNEQQHKHIIFSALQAGIRAGDRHGHGEWRRQGNTRRVQRARNGWLIGIDMAGTNEWNKRDQRTNDTMENEKGHQQMMEKWKINNKNGVSNLLKK